MTLSENQRVRLKVSDPPTLADSVYLGDGTAVSFTLPHRNLTSGTAYVPVAAGWSATGATFDPTGTVTFSARISAGSAFRTTYVYSTFSEEEITDFLALGGNVIGAALEAAHALAFDGLRRARWSAPDGSSWDDQAAQKHVMDLIAMLETEQGDEAAAAGSAESWSLTQGDY